MKQIKNRKSQVRNKNSQQTNRRCKEIPSGNLELKNAITKIENFAMCSIIEWKGQRKKKNQWTETKQWKLTKPEQQRKNKL